MRHVNRCALIPNINDLYALCVQAHPNGHDVATTQTIDPLHALAFQIAGDQGSD
jgi:hypothetical protein